MSLRRATGQGVMWSGLGFVGQNIIALAFSIVTARLLSPEVFGILGLSIVVIAVGSLVADSGTQAALVHREHRIDEAVNTALISVPLAGLGACALGVAAAPLLAWFYGEPQVFEVAAALSGVLVIRSLGVVPDALLQRRFQFKRRRAVVDPLAAVAGGVASTVLAILGAGVWALVAGWYATTIVTSLGSWLLVRYRPRLGLASIQAWRELTRYGRQLLGAQTVQLAYGYLDTVTIGKNLSPDNVGWYGAANRLALLPVSGLTHVAGQALFPAFSRVRGDMDRLRGGFLEALRYLSLLTVPICVALAAVATPLVVTLFGDVWRPSGAVIAIMMAWAVPYSFFEVAGELFKSVGRPGLIFLLTCVKFGAFLVFLAGIWVAGVVSLNLVAVGFSLAMIISTLAAVPLLKRAAGLSVAMLWRALRPTIVGGVVAAAVIIPAARFGLDGLEDWSQIAGVPLGPVAPLVAMGVVTLATAGLFVAGAALTERGMIHELIASVRALAGRRTVPPDPPGGLPKAS